MYRTLEGAILNSKHTQLVTGRGGRGAIFLTLISHDSFSRSFSEENVIPSGLRGKREGIRENRLASCGYAFLGTILA